MNRRAFLGALAPAAVGLAASTAVRHEDAGGLVGHIDMKHPLAAKVDKVFVDGRGVDKVFELNDDEGWVRRYTKMAYPLPVEKLFGRVTIQWRQAT